MIGCTERSNWGHSAAPEGKTKYPSSFYHGHPISWQHLHIGRYTVHTPWPIYWLCYRHMEACLAHAKSSLLANKSTTPYTFDAHHGLACSTYCQTCRCVSEPAPLQPSQSQHGSTQPDDTYMISVQPCMTALCFMIRKPMYAISYHDFQPKQCVPLHEAVLTSLIRLFAAAQDGRTP